MAKSKEFAAFAPGLVLLVIAVLINYLDRGTLSLAAPLLKAEWGISASHWISHRQDRTLQRGPRSYCSRGSRRCRVLDHRHSQSRTCRMARSS